MTLTAIRDLVQADYDAVNQFIKNDLQSQLNLIDELSQHIISSGGKRLRPLVVLLSTNACNYQGHTHISLAAAIEYFHTATLLHDDVIDESTLRRGKDTANTIWGSKASILVGDYLFSQAFQFMVASNNITILSLLSETATTITCGEVQQLMNRNDPQLSEQQYMDVIYKKTAILFSASAQIGAILAARPDQEVQAMADYGLYLGNAFQLIDDALDYCGLTTTIGKNVGDDLAEGKATLPLIHALHHSNKQQQQVIHQAIQKNSTDNLEEISAIIKSTKAIDYTYQIAQKEIDKALTALQIIPNSVYKEGLEKLAHFVIDRKH